MNVKQKYQYVDQMKHIYILYWTATVSPRCPLREVRDKSNIWTISRAGYLSDGLIEKLGVFSLKYLIDVIWRDQ